MSTTDVLHFRAPYNPARGITVEIAKFAAVCALYAFACEIETNRVQPYVDALGSLLFIAALCCMWVLVRSWLRAFSDFQAATFHPLRLKATEAWKEARRIEIREDMVQIMMDREDDIRAEAMAECRAACGCSKTA